jgi:hypothetical protein
MNHAQPPPRRNHSHRMTDAPHDNRPAAYVVYLARGLIQRRCGEDKSAIMSIGQTSDIGERMQHFRTGLRTGRGHSEANFLHWLNTCVPPRHRVGLENLVYTFSTCDDEDQAMQLEADWLCAYAHKFGELPPLNRSLPRRALERSLTGTRASGGNERRR